jgi:trans-2,3-dihydro-3-hydroxyanthranilate isomerase
MRAGLIEMRRRYVTVDVFAERQFGGNPLAVVLDAQGLSAGQMQSIASEFNYSETTFVLAPKDANHTAEVRIFTPRSEIPFAGHPNVGTAYVLARRDRAMAAPCRLIFEEQAGLVPVEILMEGADAIGAELTAPEPLTRRSRVSPDDVARCLCLEPIDIMSDAIEPQVISVGLPFLIAELKSREALRRAKPDIAAHEEILPLDGADAIYFFTRDTAGSDPACDLAARMFSPLAGIVEDPATGSATVAVAAILAENVPERDVEIRMRFVQGVDMGRPSLLLTRVQKRSGKIESAHVGGRCVQVMEGVLDLVEQA